jgi:hypothetical protein
VLDEVAPVYGSSSIRVRRTRAEINAIREALFETLAEDHPMTVRQVFYRLVSRGAIAKTEAEYQRTVIRLLGEMRREKIIPFHWIADNTRWQRKPTTFSSIEHLLRNAAQAYRRALWDNQSAYVEVWLEKDALAGVVMEETEPWDVPLMVTRGYPSLSYLHTAAETIAAQEKPTFLYYLGDHDPSGVDIPRKVEEDIRTFAPGAQIGFERIAVTPEQISALGLQTRPTKKTDTRINRFEGESVEVDAIPPRVLREIVRRHIVQHVDEHQLSVQRVAEQSERDWLEWVAVNYGNLH